MEVGRRVSLPIDLREVEEALGSGTVVLSRRFHPPRQLDPGERIFCRLVEVPGLVEVRVNGEIQSLSGTTDGLEFEVATSLKANNLLELKFTFAKDRSEPAGILGSVSLEFGPE